MRKDVKFSETVIKTDIENLYLIPSSITLSDVEIELVNVVGRE